jgi:hypothetical protein
LGSIGEYISAATGSIGSGTVYFPHVLTGLTAGSSYTLYLTGVASGTFSQNHTTSLKVTEN